MAQSWIYNNKDERVVIEFDDTTHAWNDWKHGLLADKTFVHEQYAISVVDSTKTHITLNDSYNNTDRSMSFESIDVPSRVTIMPKIDINCHVCHKYQGQLYACRICGKVYHPPCIKDIGIKNSSHIIKNATTLIGWTCPLCEDLRTLLPSEELTETNEWLKSLGNQPSFNFDNYINTRIKIKSHDRMKIILQMFLNTITDMTPNRLTQIDLLILDVTMKIIYTSPRRLVNSLTPFELYRLNQIFTLFSSTDNPCTTYDKYLHVIIPELDSEEKNLHLEALTYSLLGNTTKFDRTWTQFVLNSTIPTLLERYNYRLPLDFINQTVSIRQSISSTPVNIFENQHNSSVTTLMHNIAQKLKQTGGNDIKSIRDSYDIKHMKIGQRKNERIKR